MGDGPHTSLWISSPNLLAGGAVLSLLIGLCVNFAYLQESHMIGDPSLIVWMPVIAPLEIRLWIGSTGMCPRH